MSAQSVTPEQFASLQKLPDYERAKAEAALAAADGPADLDAIMAEVRAEVMAERIEAERGELVQDCETSGEDVPTWTLLGRPARPLSVGVLRVLEMVGSPIASDTGAEVSYYDIAALLFALTCPDRRDLLRLARDRAKFEEAVVDWSFDLTPDVLDEAWGEVSARMPKGGGDDDGGNPTA